MICFIILFNAGGYYFVYYQAQNYFKQLAFGRINDFIPVENLTLVKIDIKNGEPQSTDEFERVNGHEIKYYGNMYDIYQEEIKGDTLFIYCLSDENEDKLDEAFSDYVNKDNGNMMNVPVKNILMSIIKIALPPVTINYGSFSFYNYISIKPANILLTEFIDVLVPPPKTVIPHGIV